MSKLKLEQYFTSPDIAEYCFKKTLEVIGEENISEFIESSSGEGVFLDMIEKYTPNIPYKAYDIDVRDERVIEQDFLKLEMEYRKGRLTGFNPPYGNSNNLLRSFYNKGCELGDYIAFICGVKLYNNTKSLFKFDLIHSEKLGKVNYSGIELNTCFNIYKRPINGLNKRINFKLKDVLVVADDKRCKRYPIINEDFKICRMGCKVWKILDEGQILRNFKIVVNRKEFLPKIKKSLTEKYLLDGNNRDLVISTPYITATEVYEYLKEMIPELE